MSSTLAPPLISHGCCVPGCTTRLPRGRTMCTGCWRRVPLERREAVWAAWRAHTDPVGYIREGAAYVAAYTAAIESVAQA